MIWFNFTALFVSVHGFQKTEQHSKKCDCTLRGTLVGETPVNDAHRHIDLESKYLWWKSQVFMDHVSSFPIVTPLLFTLAFTAHVNLG